MGIRPVNGKIEKNWIDKNFLSGDSDLPLGDMHPEDLVSEDILSNNR